ncbi:hypothetical protein HCC18_09495 [Listeria booriae]|uniref:right-handed parallel beta-helix repeat-containing protein n=1 Tax=Listeria booriae TaxID=1552123 RepID=UPI001626FA2C|nr:right-handed parallel beta-helix repeat-containing protein [Listeria booriae]MBC2317084.1 hypothetical protein [Listeria booriae]
MRTIAFFIGMFYNSYCLQIKFKNYGEYGMMKMYKKGYGLLTILVIMMGIIWYGSLDTKAAEIAYIKYYTGDKLEAKTTAISNFDPASISNSITGSLNIAVRYNYTRVQLPEGTYQLNQTLNVPSGITLEGSRDDNGNNLTTLAVPELNVAGEAHVLNTQALITADSGTDVRNTTIRRLILDGGWHASSNRLVESQKAIFLSPFPQSKKAGDGYYKDVQRKHDISVEDMTIRNFGGSGIYMDFVKDVTIGEINSDQEEKSNSIESIGYGGIIGYSVDYVKIHNTLISDVGLDGKQAYGIAVSWYKGTTDANQLADDDRSRFEDTADGEALWKQASYTNGYYPSTNVTIKNNVIMNIASWEALDTHSGKNIKFIGNHVMGVRFPIVVGGMDYEGATISAYPPENILISENKINQATDVQRYKPKAISSERGIVATGTQFNDLTKENMGFLKTLTIKNNEVSDIQAIKNIHGGISIHVTYGAQVLFNRVDHTLFNGLVLMSSNKKTILENNTVTDMKEAPSNEVSASLGIRGSHNNGNSTNDYLLEPLTDMGTSFINNILDGSYPSKNIFQIYQNPVSTSNNMLNFGEMSVVEPK